MRHVWQGGGDANDPQRLQDLQQALQPARDPNGEDVKAELRAATDQAIADGVFGVPTVTLEGRHFWGLDALPMVRDALLGGAWFEGAGWEDAERPRGGVVRR